MQTQPMTADGVPGHRCPKNEFANALTHGLGLLLSVAGGIALFSAALMQGERWRVAGCGVFAATLIAVYAFSTLSHCAFRPELIRLFRRLDQGAIYLFIAGTYTPVALAWLHDDWSWLLWLIWAMALFGCFSKLLFAHRMKTIALWTYVVLGWMPMIAVGAMLERVPLVALSWLIAGGLCYFVGTAFLVLDGRRNFFHAIWHLCVIAGSACHFFIILLFVA